MEYIIKIGIVAGSIIALITAIHILTISTTNQAKGLANIYFATYLGSMVVVVSIQLFLATRIWGNTKKYLTHNRHTEENLLSIIEELTVEDVLKEEHSDTKINQIVNKLNLISEFYPIKGYHDIRNRNINASKYIEELGRLF